MSVSKIFILIIYSIVVLSLYPILSYLLYDVLRLPQLPYQPFIQVFFSAPLLLITGAILFLIYKQRIAGGIVGLMGLAWLIAILSEVIEKTQ